MGVIGSQPNMAEYYITTGSLYLCTVGLLPLAYLQMIHSGPVKLKIGQAKNFGKALTFLLIMLIKNHK